MRTTPNTMTSSLPASKQAGRLQKFIETTRCYASLPRHAHTPDLHLAPVNQPKRRGKYFWILDNAQKIGMVNLEIGEIELFRFFPPPAGTLVDYKLPNLYDWRTLFGVRICIVPQGTWSCRGELTGLQNRGVTLSLTYRETLQDNSLMSHSFTLRFDPVLGYVLDCAFDLRMEKPHEFEYANMLAAGLMESRDERKRYQKCIWARRDGKICYQYQNPLSCMQLAGRAWSHIPRSGFVGWVAEREMNPFLEIVRATPSCFVTCSMWYDQHVFGLPPRRRSRDGFYHIEAVYRLISLPLPVAKELEDAARTMLPTDLKPPKAGFRCGVVNDFETPIPAGTLYNGCAWTREAVVDSSVAHSGTCSLQVSGGRQASTNAGGTGILLDSGKRYRLSAWVRTRNVTGGAFLRLDEIFLNWGDVRARHQTRRLSGNRDWTLVECEFQPVPEDPMALLSLVVEGKGTAWFDDVALVETGK